MYAVTEEWKKTELFAPGFFYSPSQKFQVRIYLTLMYMAKIGQKCHALNIFPEHKMSIR